LDGTEFELDNNGGVRVIYQVEDDHSRMILAQGHDSTENGRTSIRVVSQAISDYGTPRRFLTDNHSSLNATRRGLSAPLEVWLSDRGVEAITGRPGKPTTQGKAERLHQTLKKYLEASRPISTNEELDQCLEDFADHYNKRRPHQSLGRMTPAEAWAATPKAEPPTPPVLPRARPRHGRKIIGQYEVDGKIIVARKVSQNGVVNVAGCHIYIGKFRRGQTVQVELTETTFEIYNRYGASLGVLRRPSPGGPRNLSFNPKTEFFCG